MWHQNRYEIDITLSDLLDFMNKEIIALAALVAIIISLIGSGSFISLSNGQSLPQANNSTTGSVNKPLPVLLIHGYASDVSLWKIWEDLLKKDGIPFYPITSNLIINGSPLVHASNICEPAVED